MIFAAVPRQKKRMGMSDIPILFLTELFLQFKF